MVPFLLACSSPVEGTVLDPTATFDTGRAPIDSEGDVAPDVDEQDAAVVLQHTLPSEMSCGEEVAAQVVVRNTGQSIWTREAGFKLGVVEDEDPFYGPDTRVWLSPDVSIPPGGSHAFSFTMVAPQQEGTFTTDWQMVHEGVRWFGETVVQSVQVQCDDEETVSEPPPLDQLVWLHSDISSWPQTRTLSAVTVSDSQICMENDGVHEWPIETFDGTELVGNPWIVLEFEGVWYAATWEWLRPGQECKNRASVNGDHIKKDPLKNWSPESGETYWFMVSGLARFSERNVEERTNLVPVVWP